MCCFSSTMNYLFRICCLSAALMTLPSCSSYLASPAPAAPASPVTGVRSADSRILVKTGTMSLEVTDVELSTQQARQVTKKHRGYLENISSSQQDQPYARLELRIPKDRLSAVMDELASLGKVTSREIEVEDVTGQWVDLQAKLKNMRALRDRLRTLLSKAQNVKEMLEVEKELARVQSDLDSLEGRLKAMSKHNTYSKLTLSIRQKSVPGPIGAVGKGAWWSVKKLFVLR